MSKKIIEDSEENIEKVKKLYKLEYSIKKIASEFNVGPTTIIRFFERNSIETRSREEAYELRRLSIHEKEKIIDLYFTTGLNREKIAEKLQLSIYSVKSVIADNRLPGKEKFKLNFEKNTIPINYDQRQLILGSLLGDACLQCRNHNGCEEQMEFSIVHGLPQLEYIKYASNILNSNISKTIQGTNSFGAGNEIFRTSYSNKYELIKIYKITHVNKRKTITEEWLNNIDSLALSYWFMDDGCSYYSNKKATSSVMFATQSFNALEHDMLRSKLLDFGIDSNLRKVATGTGLNIYIKQKSVNLFMDIVEPYISKIPCMEYKIKRKYKNEKN